MSFDATDQKAERGLDQDLADFVIRFLKNHGAALERKARAIEALLPENLSVRLNLPEYIQISGGTSSVSDSAPDRNAEDVYFINYGSPLLESMVRTACEELPFVFCKLEFDYLKSQGFDKLIKEAFDIYGAVGKVESSAKVNTQYLLVTSRYMAQSDEQKEGLIDLIFNLETGAYVPEMVQMLPFAHRNFQTDITSADWGESRTQEIIEWITRETAAAVAQEIGPFQASMTRRFRRDVANLEEYYSSLSAEMEKSLERPGLSDQLIKDRKEKIAMLPDELQRKKDDLFKKYSIKVKVEPCSTMLIETPAVKILYRASIGKKHRNFSFIYNPTTKSLDALVCQGCGSSTTAIHFCDGLHLLCTDCSKTCPVCSK